MKFAYAGHGVAMANASEPLRAIANDITTYTNDQDEAARYLVDFFK